MSRRNFIREVLLGRIAIFQRVEDHLFGRAAPLNVRLFPRRDWEQCFKFACLTSNLDPAAAALGFIGEHKAFPPLGRRWSSLLRFQERSSSSGLPKDGEHPQE